MEGRVTVDMVTPVRTYGEKGVEQMKELIEDIKHVWHIAKFVWMDRRHARRGGNPDEFQF